MTVPGLVPVLSRGKHRKPAKGACFMEFASYLAGERWSDQPACTHPLLAALARSVNDLTSDDRRGRLVQLIPSVIGLTSDDVRVDARLALRAARTALPVASADLQRVMAVSVRVADRVLADLEGRRPDALEDASRLVLEQAPHATAWARGFSRDVGMAAKGFRRTAAPNAVRWAVHGIAHACIPDPDELLRDLLAGAIADTESIVGARVAREPVRVPAVS